MGHASAERAVQDDVELSEDDWIELFWHFTALARATSRPEFLPGVWVLQVNVRQNAANQPWPEAERRANDALMVAREDNNG